MGKKGITKEAPYPSSARFKFGGGRVGGVKRAVDIKVGIAGRQGAFTAFALDAEIPALLDAEIPRLLDAVLDAFVRGCAGRST